VTDYTWPSTVTPSSSALTWMDNTVIFRSPISGSIRTESRPGGRWHLSLTVNNIKRISQASDPLRLLEAFLYKLNGSEHRAVIPDFTYERVGPGTGYNPPTVVPSVLGAGQTGLSLSTSGWAYNTLVLYAGDRIGISGQMIPVTANVTSNGTGLATISLAHPIRVAVANATPLELTAPTARFVLVNNASFASEPGVFKTTLVEFEEVIP